MSECRNSLLRCMRAIAAETSTGPRPYLQKRIAPHARSSLVSRKHSTSSTRRREAVRNHSTGAEDTPNALARPSVVNGVPLKSYDAPKTWINNNKHRAIVPSEQKQRDEPTKWGMSAALEKRIRTELQYLPDPLRLADHVRAVLNKGDTEKALGLVRIASRDMECVVSWNHLLGHFLANKQMTVALKLYNEMKKRAQFPDSYTYVILLRGLSEPPVAADTVGKALSIYHSLGSETSRVKPATIHTNAVLRVCARAHDMDSLWGIAAKIPQRGPGAADAYTYTTILNAIREHALRQGGDRTDDSEVSALRATAVQQGRRIWGDIVGRWRSGDIVVNEEMVGAMGRLLLIGLQPRDWDDVLSLVEQTMGIPRLIPRLGDKTRKQTHLPVRPPAAVRRDMDDVNQDEEPESAFDRELVLNKQGNTSVVHVKPGNNTLSLLLDACKQSYAMREAYEYWNLLTNEATYNLQIDADNLHTYLRILRQTRASSRALDIVRDTFPHYGLTPQRKTFRIAMSACSRDKNNHAAIRNAHSLVYLIEYYKIEPDPRLLLQYLELAISTLDGKVISQAIEQLTDPIAQLKSMFSFGKTTSGKTSETDKRDIMKLIRTIVGAIDQMTNKQLIPPAEIAVWVQRRSKLNAFITRFMDRMDRNNVIPKEKLVELRKETRQLRHLRAKVVEKQKKADGTWVEDRSKLKPYQPKDLLDSPL